MSEKFDASWFDLSKYDGLIELDLAGWEHQLAVRQWLYGLIMNPRKLKSVDRKRVESEGLIASWLSAIKKCPLLQYEYEPEFMGDTRLFIMNPLPSDTYLVSSIRLHDICSEAQTLPYTLEGHGLNPEIRNLHEYTSQYEQEVIDAPYSTYIDGVAGYNKAIAWIKVSLQGTDDEIIKSFQTWLTEYRKEINYFSKEKSFTDKTLAGWIKDRLLPYIDLSIITKYETNQQLEHHVAAQLIFPDEYDVNVPERIRKTIKSKAELLVSEKILSAMQAQLANSST